MFMFCFNLATVLFLGATLPLCDSWSSLSGLPDMFWNEDYLISKIKVRLVKKSWKPKGLTFDEYVAEFPGTVNEAYSILRGNKGYDYISRPLTTAVELFTDQEAGYDPSLDSIIMIHPLFSSADENYFTKPTVTALGMRNIHRKYNLFLFDMPILNLNFFFSLFRELIGIETRYEEMSVVLSSFIVNSIQKRHWQPENLNIIAYSYSGNLAGYIARSIHLAFPDKKKLSSLMCLDPYTAGYNENLIQVSRDDAQVVHIYHTSSYFGGTRERIGTADFVFNNGFVQPECVGTKTILKRLLFSSSIAIEPLSCSHLRVVPRFWYIILFTSKFRARRCDTWPRFKNCHCENHSETAYLAYPILDRSLQGTFYLKTIGTKPYGLEEEGYHCAPEDREKLERKSKEQILKLKNKQTSLEEN